MERMADMSKGTIIYIGGFELPDKNAAAHRVMANAKIFSKLGYSTVFIGVDKDLKFDSSINTTKQDLEGFECWRTPYPKSSKEWFNYLTSIYRFLEIVNKYDDVKAVICYNYQTIAFARIIKYCRAKSIKVISDCTEWYGVSEGNILYKIIKYLDTVVRMKIINRGVDALIVVSNYLRKYYKYKAMVVIPTLVNMNNLIEPNYLTSDIVNLFYAGIPFRLGRPLKNRKLAKDRLDKAIKYLFGIYQKNMNVAFRFDIYGMTKEQYIEVFPDDEYMLDKLKNNVFFHGYRNNEEVRNALRFADFTILIRDENRMTQSGFPTKFTESINCGIPVITTNTSDLDAYLVEGKNGFFIDKDNDNLAEKKLEKILTLDSAEINTMKEYCFKSNIFNIENWVEATRPIFEELKKA